VSASRAHAGRPCALPLSGAGHGVRGVGHWGIILWKLLVLTAWPTRLFGHFLCFSGPGGCIASSSSDSVVRPVPRA